MKYKKIKKKNYKYVLQEQISFYIPKIQEEVSYLTDKINILLRDNILLISRNYAWDGCSGPTWDDLTNMRAGLIHDVLYQLIELKKLNTKYRKTADQIFHYYLLNDGMNRFRAFYYYLGVRWFGGIVLKRNIKRNKIYEI